MTIIPRTKGSLGYTMSLPDHDRYIERRSHLLGQLAMFQGGRAAESLVFSDPTTGAENDLDKATELAREMVTRFGMSEEFPFRTFGKQGEVFLGRDYLNKSDHGPATEQMIDDATNALLRQAYENAERILARHRNLVDAMAAKLKTDETILRGGVDELFGEAPKWVLDDDGMLVHPDDVA